MDHASFQEWMANIEQHSSMQYQQVEAAFSGGIGRIGGGVTGSD